MTSRIPLIIDTDTAQDDCVALLVGLLDPVADLRAITMVAGNVGFERQVLNAWMTLSVAGRLGEVPVYLGCRRPMVREWVSAENVHGDGAGGLTMDFEGLTPEPEHGVDALIAQVGSGVEETDEQCDAVVLRGVGVDDEGDAGCHAWSFRVGSGLENVGAPGDLEGVDDGLDALGMSARGHEERVRGVDDDDVLHADE